MRKQVYLKIIERLKQADLGIKHFDLWNTATTLTAPGRTFQCPAVFIEFQNIEWVHVQQRVRTAQMRINIHLVTDVVGSAKDGSSQQEQALGYFVLIDEVNRALHGLSAEGMGSLILVESISDHENLDIRHSVECFMSCVADTSACKNYVLATEVEPLLNIS